LLLPVLWSGSVQHFYHFLFGYLLPVSSWLQEEGTEKFSVRDCGTMNRWWKLLGDDIDLEILSPGKALQRLLQHEQSSVSLAPLDDPSTYCEELLTHFRSMGHAYAGIDISIPTETLLVDRAPGDAFFASSESEIEGSGRERRSLPNASEIGAALRAPLTYLEYLSPLEQIRLLASTHLLIAQHGAALANMVWMPPGGRVVEIQPPQAPIPADMFRRLAEECRLDHSIVPQEHDHAPVEVQQIINSISS
jgi:hypothetical protein